MYKSDAIVYPTSQISLSSGQLKYFNRMFPLEEVEFHRYFTTVARNMKMIFDQNLGIKLVN